MPTQFETLLYQTEPPVAIITLNRPEHLNTIVPPMPDEVQDAVHRSVADPAVRVIVLRGAGVPTLDVLVVLDGMAGRIQGRGHLAGMSGMYPIVSGRRCDQHRGVAPFC